MAYTNNNNGNRRYNNNNNRGGNYNNNQTPRPKKMKMTFPIPTDFYTYDRQGNATQVDRNAVYAAIEDLCNNNVFSTLTVNVTIPRDILLNDGKRGSLTVGFINGFDLDASTVEVTIYATSVENMKAIADSLMVIPKINAWNGEFRSFTGFSFETIKDEAE